MTMKPSLKQKALDCMAPKPCPMPLIRLGGDRDGAYLIPDDTQGIKACFSPGVNNSKDFEDDLVTRHGIRCHMCDFTSNPEKLRTPIIEGMQTLEKKWLDIDGADNSISLKDWVTEHAPDPNDDLMLQIDIEGAEYRNLLNSSDILLARFRIIVLELHGLKAFRRDDLLAREVAPLLEKLDRNHICVHAHPNNCCGEFLDQETGLNIPSVIELTFLRRDRFRGDPAQYIQPQLPHPLDIDRSTTKKPPLYLNEKWLPEAKRSDQMKIKILSEELRFARQESAKALPRSPEADAVQAKALLNLYRSADSSLLKASPDDQAHGDRGNDLAHGKPFALKSSYRNFPIKGVVEESAKFFFHTDLGINQSITVDLLAEFTLGQLVIRNRLDGYQERAAMLFWICHSDPNPAFDDIYPVIISSEFIKNGRTEACTPLLRKRGRYLTIFSPLHTALHFSALRVYQAVA